jgi:hypothetical protein
MEELEKELVRVHALNNLRLYKLVPRGWCGIAEGRTHGRRLGKAVGESVWKTLEKLAENGFYGARDWRGLRGPNTIRGRGDASRKTDARSRSGRLRDWVEKRDRRANGFQLRGMETRR